MVGTASHLLPTCSENEYNIKNGNQYGYQKGKNINKLLGNFANVLNTSLSKGWHSMILFLDFSKAFETIPHKVILKSLERIGVRGEALNLFKHYLENRSFVVKIKDAMSTPETLSCGVPQGSKLGPLLYLIVANNLLENIKSPHVFAYADDTAVIVTDENFCVAQQKIQNEATIISQWCHDNGLILNVKKSKIMYVRSSRWRTKNVNIKIKDLCTYSKNGKAVEVEQVSFYKYLGVYVDQHLNWHEQIDKIRGKLRSTAYALNHLRYSVDKNLLLNIYYALGESYLRYGITAWGSSTKCSQLQKSQDCLVNILRKSGVKEKILSVRKLYLLSLANFYFQEEIYREKKDGKYKVAKFGNTYGKFT